MRERHEAVFEERFTAAVAFLEESGRGDDRGLDLAVAESLALVDGHFAVAGSLESTQLVVFLCG